jgi:hypothetical protein
MQSHLDWVLKMITQAAMDFIAVREIMIEIPSVEFNLDVKQRFPDANLEEIDHFVVNYLGVKTRVFRKTS